ncbi:hypothetical protein ACVWZL_004797 [Bradyrhizobium sp. GM2.4]
MHTFPLIDSWGAMLDEFSFEESEGSLVVPAKHSAMHIEIRGLADLFGGADLERTTHYLSCRRAGKYKESRNYRGAPWRTDHWATRILAGGRILKETKLTYFSVLLP